MLKILVIEDEDSLRKEILDILETEGFISLGAEDGQLGLYLAQTQHPDLILCDVMMPGANGYEVLSQLRQDSDTALIPFIFLTAKGTREDVRQGMNLGADDYLTKPFSLDELLEAIAARLAKQEAVLQAHQNHAAWDSLTRLPSKPYLIDQLNRLIHRATTNPSYQYAVLFVGLDRLKEIGDAFGQVMSDRLLQTVAAELRQMILTLDQLLAYFGGDEFIIVLENIPDISTATHLAEQIHDWSLKHAFELGGCEVFSSMSIGITHSQFHYGSSIELLADAALAMHYARAASEAGYVTFKPAMRISLSEQLQLETDLRRAILEGTYAGKQEFCLYYQPIVHLLTHRLVGFEALIRWNHPERGLISPMQFIALAEAKGLIDELGWWVIQAACHQLSKWQQQFPQYADLTINVNLSALQLKQNDFNQRLLEILDHNHLSGKCLKLEVTESCLLDMAENKNDIFQSLKLSEVQLCIDDFGTGYSCLSRLHQLPIDTLKIDRSFVSQIDTNGQNAVIQTIVALANSLNINIVAEGIETPSQLKKLTELNCQLGQGYLFAQPLTSQAATQFMIDAIHQASSKERCL